MNLQTEATTRSSWSFANWVTTKPENTDYLNRLKALANEERDSFVFQEYIRKTHAARIKYWITGTIPTMWSTALASIIDQIRSPLIGLPERFVANLGDICESHHSSAIDDRDVFPLCQRYSDHNLALANVQYAAILLRTVDLLQVSNNRTPSVMFRLLNISDPLGILMWRQHRGTFSVNMKSRTLDLGDPTTHTIGVSADYEEEQPFFSLTEYISYAKLELEANKRWADASRQSLDAKDYHFPWSDIEGNIRVSGNLPRKLRFELDRGRLLDLLVGHTIYNDATVAVRELLQNAIDAVRTQEHLDRQSGEVAQAVAVTVTWISADMVLYVQDHGVGMDLQIILDHLMKVGSSFYESAAFRNLNALFTPISRFGIGILTCFMISDDVEIFTKRKGAKGFRIRMSSVHADYLLKELPRGSEELTKLGDHGTIVRLKLRASVALPKGGIEDILRYWIILPPCPIAFQQDDRQSTWIGFPSIGDAVEFWCTDLAEGGRSAKFEVATFRKGVGRESYELGIAIDSDTSFERSYRMYRPAERGRDSEDIGADRQWHLTRPSQRDANTLWRVKPSKSALGKGA